jgi:thymidylate synthase (FAD)
MNVQRVSKTGVDESFLEGTLEDTDIEREELPENLTEALIIYIARVSSSRTNKWEDHHKLINFLIREGHWSPFEHAFVTYEIETSRAIGRQLLRHRSFTFQEFSQRYAEVTETEDIELRKQPDHNRQSSAEEFNPDLEILGEDKSASDKVDNILGDVLGLYKKLLANGVATETARMILPGATTTTIYMSGPLRSWIHFLDLRDDGASQKEIRQIAKEIRNDISSLFPNVAIAAGITPFRKAELAVCQHGRVGRIKDIQVEDGRLLYTGETIHGDPWQSVDPRRVSEVYSELDKEVKEQFDSLDIDVPNAGRLSD